MRFLPGARDGDAGVAVAVASAAKPPYRPIAGSALRFRYANWNQDTSTNEVEGLLRRLKLDDSKIVAYIDGRRTLSLPWERDGSPSPTDRHRVDGIPSPPPPAIPKRRPHRRGDPDSPVGRAVARSSRRGRGVDGTRRVK